MLRQFLILLLIVLAGVLIAYHNIPGMRESFRGFRVEEKDEEQFDAYRQGKKLFLSQWEGANKPSLAAWDDDRWEGAESLDGEKWLAHGRYTQGSEVRTPWCILFVINSGRTFVRQTGTNAIRVLQMASAGRYREAMMQYPVESERVFGPPIQPRVPQNWGYHSPLDASPRR